MRPFARQKPKRSKNPKIKESPDAKEANLKGPTRAALGFASFGL
jgi:hypothetical protein